MENSIEDRINNAYCFLNSMHSDFRTGLYYKEDLENLEHILSDYKKVLKENERYKKSDYETICLENNKFREITDRIQSEYNDLLKDNFKLKNELETKRKEYQETYKDVREELKELRKENEENKCLHCGRNEPGYCEECYQELIGENAKLQTALKAKDKIIDLMAIDVLACGFDFINFGILTGNFTNDKEKVIKFYERKVENE